MRIELYKPFKPTHIALHPDQKRALEEQAEAAQIKCREHTTEYAMEKLVQQFMKNIERGIQDDI